MKRTLALLALCVCLFAADPLTAKRSAGNDNVEVEATLWMEPSAITAEVGAPLEDGTILARVKWSNKTGNPLHVGPADFVLISRRNGERAEALAPGQIAGGSALIVTRDRSARLIGSLQNEQGIAGVKGMSKTDQPLNNELLTTLKAKELPDRDANKDSVEGLVYFSMDSKKLKLKDLSLLYKGSGGRLTLDFK